MPNRKVEIEFKGKITIVIDEGKNIDDALAELDTVAGGDYYEVESMEVFDYEIIDSK